MTGNTGIKFLGIGGGRKLMKSTCISCGSTKTTFVKKMEGSRMDLHKSITGAFSNVTLPFQKYKGEMHLPSYSFCGPGTNLGKRMSNVSRGDALDAPINHLDRICFKHDLVYHKVSGD